ncbi:MAG: histidine--tRNA ligase [Bacteroidetes bacterium]|nr:MAG: histidine--tRNA ligase [Bacteroidota bacterium]
MSQKPAIPKGTRDFMPLEMARRNYLFDTIRKAFKKYGFAPIETPSFEKSSTLMGKYGEEGDRLIFRILNSGEKLKKADLAALDEGKLARFATSLSEKALRYDLTVPFARFVVQHQSELSFPFKRYQIQAVWRADRPQHGRYQEFYQCDADVVGSDSLMYEVELIHLFDEVLSELRIPSFTIKVNNRKILSGIAEITGEGERLIAMTVALDKLDKIGRDGVEKEMREKGISEQAIQAIGSLFELEGSPVEQLGQLKSFLAESEIGMKGIEELEYVLGEVQDLGLRKAELVFDVTLARGLNYYTGAIFEVEANGVKMGSICGGGRYDDLTGLFGLKGVSGVGISFGADRIYDVLTELKLFPEETDLGLSVLFLNFGEKEERQAFRLVHELRTYGVDTELYPKAAKIQKQMKYANDRKVRWVALLGESEMEAGQVVLKEMSSGEQHVYGWEEFKKMMKKYAEENHR